LYGATFYNVILRLIAVVRGGDWGGRFVTASVTFILGYIIWYRQPEQGWDLPTEAIAELKKRLGP
jgi:hypothetical protein